MMMMMIITKDKKISTPRPSGTPAGPSGAGRKLRAALQSSCPLAARASMEHRSAPKEKCP